MNPKKHRLPALPAALTLLAAALLAVRLGPRDAVPFTAWAYYFVPWPLLSALLAAAALVWLGYGFRRTAAAAFLLAAACGAYWAGRSDHEAPCVPPENGASIMFWNISRGRASWPRIADEIAANNADLTILAEAGKPDAELLDFWRRRFSGRHVASPGGGLLLISATPARDVEIRELDGISRLLEASVDLSLGGGAPVATRLIVVDLDASPRFDKRKLVAETFAAADAHEGEPRIVVGDFNTPIDSRWFRDPRSRYSHAFEESGDGRLATWPARLPLTAIDHLWISPELASHCTTLEPTLASDHRAIRTILTRSGTPGGRP